MRRQRRVGPEPGAAVASPVLLGLVGVGSLGDVPEPPERKKTTRVKIESIIIGRDCSTAVELTPSALGGATCMQMQIVTCIR